MKEKFELSDHLSIELERGRALAKSGNDRESIDHFRGLADRYPEHGVVQAELAYAYDRAGREEEAVEPYRRALALGLPDSFVSGHLLGLGSTLRNVGEFDEAVSVLEGAAARFPDDNALKVFLAFAYQSRGNSAKAVVTLLNLIQAAPCIDLGGFERAIRFYTDELDSHSG